MSDFEPRPPPVQVVSFHDYKRRGNLHLPLGSRSLTNLLILLHATPHRTSSKVMIEFFIFISIICLCRFSHKQSNCDLSFLNITVLYCVQ